MVMSIEESLADLPTSNLPETPTLEVRKSNLSQEDICGVIRDIASIEAKFNGKIPRNR